MQEDNTHTTANSKCPRCRTNSLHPTKTMNSLCRRDNKTYICSPCGQAQAIQDLMAHFTNQMHQ